MASRICVTIGRGRHRHLLAEYKHLAEQGAQLVELRLDYLQSEVNLKRILAERFCPVVITCRREQDGGLWQGTEQQRLTLLRTAIVEGVDYVDLEEDVAGGIPRFGKTKRIVSYHNFHETPRDLEAIHARLASLNADYVKMATLTNSQEDNFRMLRLTQNASIPTIGFCMGEIGAPSRVLLGKFGSPLTYATFQIERTMAPGQMSYATMKDVCHYEELTSETEVFGVIADPVAHSMSPLLHNACFMQGNMNRVYLPFRVSREQLPFMLKNASELGIKGLSVTIPHKETVLDYVDRQDDSVTAIGAANTLLFRDGALHAFNTDYQAALNCILRAYKTNDDVDSLAGVRVLILGAGGVAKAIVHGLRRCSADVMITNRSPERAEDLAVTFSCRTVPWVMRHTVKPHLIVNCTPIGMHPNVNESPYEGVHLSPECVVFDTVYNPEQTLLIKQAREAGCNVITGVEMFVGQAEAQFKYFTGETADHDTMRSALRKAISAVRTQ